MQLNQATQPQQAKQFCFTQALRAALRKSARAARANLIPGIVIWCLAATVIAGWLWSAWFAGCLQDLSAIKAQWNYPFAMLSTAIAGGVLPGIVQGLWRLHPQAWKILPWVTLFWAIKGFEINAFYEFQAYCFGNGNDLYTIASKTLFDQFVYVPLWAVPSMVIAYCWIERGRRGVIESLRQHWFLETFLPIFLANGSIWLPTVLLIYVLPTALQLPLQNLVLCFWGLMMACMSAADTSAAAAPATPATPAAKNDEPALLDNPPPIL